MPTKIKRLPDVLVNQIAAGEVVENPASIVKELVENALDAGAKKISIETLGGGHQLISVHDDGSGMGPEDALLSLERHATSKITAFEDFEQLATMGFRGEALPSIASVSRLTLKTASEHSSATLIEMHGGEMIQQEVCAHNLGTTVEVRSLFYNTPARKKFQKTAAISSSEILRSVTLLSLANPDKDFVLKQQGKIQLETTSSSEENFLKRLKTRLQAVLGEAFQNDLIEISFHDEICSIQGFLAPLRETRPNRKEQYVFINQRAVTAPLISFAIKDALGTRIEINQYPLFVLHLTLPGHLVDVNVHPQKKEVRFREERYLRGCIQKAISEALGVFLSPTSFFEMPKDNLDWSHLEKSINVESARAGFSFIMRSKGESLPAPSLNPYPAVYRTLGLYENFLLLDAKDTTEFLGNTPGIVFLDLKEAEALIRYEKIKAFEWRVEKQALLFPLSLSFSELESPLIEQKLPLFEEIGIELRSAGKNVFLIEALPSFISSDDAQKLMRVILDEPYEKNQKSELFKKLCQFPTSIKKNFMIEQAVGILKELLRLENFRTSLKGFPLFTLLEHRAIHGLFNQR